MVKRQNKTAPAALRALAMVLVLALAAAMLPLAAGAAGAMVTAKAPTGTVAPGGSFAVSFNMTGNPGFWGATLTVTYDKSALELTDFDTSGTLFASGSIVKNVAGDSIGYYKESADADTMGDGALFKASFKVKANAPEKAYQINAALRAGNAKNFINKDNETVEVAFVSGSVTVRAAGSSTTSSGGGATPPSEGTETIDDAGTPMAVIADVSVAVEVKTDELGRASVTADTVGKALEELKAAEEETVKSGGVVTVSELKLSVTRENAAPAEAPTTALNIPASAISEIAVRDNTVLTVETHAASMTFDKASLAGIVRGAPENDTVAVAVTESDETYDLARGKQITELTVTVGGREIRGFEGSVLVTLPHEPPADLRSVDYDLLTVYCLTDDGNIQEMQGARYDAAAGKVAFVTTRSGKFFVSEWLSPFTDIAKGDWYYKAVRYAYSNGLITGTTDTTFAPQTSLTRAMLITILARDAGIDTTGGDTWYSKAVDWGMTNGLTDGTNMNAPITREQFATLLYRYAKWSSADAPQSGGADLSGFADADDVSQYAREAMAWAVTGGLITGRTPTTLAPKGTATRAEAATLLQRYLENMA
jgi:hypothetical protein